MKRFCRGFGFLIDVVNSFGMGLGGVRIVRVIVLHSHNFEVHTHESCHNYYE